MTQPLSLLSDEHDAVGQLLDDLSPEARLWRPRPGEWSATDVLEHLVRVERGLLFGLRRQLDAGETRRDVGEPSPEALDAMTAFLRSDRRTRVPESAARHVAPRGDEPYADLRAEWSGLPSLWRETLAAVPEDLSETGLILHPRAGALTARGAARFAADHAAHHARQIVRLREADGFPLA